MLRKWGIFSLFWKLLDPSSPHGTWQKIKSQIWGKWYNKRYFTFIWMHFIAYSLLILLLPVQGCLGSVCKSICLLNPWPTFSFSTKRNALGFGSEPKAHNWKHHVALVLPMSVCFSLWPDKDTEWAEGNLFTHSHFLKPSMRRLAIDATQRIINICVRGNKLMDMVLHFIFTINSCLILLWIDARRFSMRSSFWHLLKCWKCWSEIILFLWLWLGTYLGCLLNALLTFSFCVMTQR